jgi:hypothetical protein
MKIFLVFVAVVSFAFGTDRLDESVQSAQQTRLEKIEQKIQKNEELLNQIPAQLNRMKKRQEFIQKVVKSQRDMVQSFMQGRAICRVQKAQNERNGMPTSEVQRFYQGCKSIIKDLDREEFAQIQRDIKQIRADIEKELFDLKLKTGQKQTYETVLKSLYNMRETVKLLNKTMEEENSE